MNKCMAEIYDPGGIRTRAARLISQYHNHWAKENSFQRSCQVLYLNREAAMLEGVVIRNNWNFIVEASIQWYESMLQVIKRLHLLTFQWAPEGLNEWWITLGIILSEKFYHAKFYHAWRMLSHCYFQYYLSYITAGCPPVHFFCVCV